MFFINQPAAGRKYGQKYTSHRHNTAIRNTIMEALHATIVFRAGTNSIRLVMGGFCNVQKSLGIKVYSPGDMSGVAVACSSLRELEQLGHLVQLPVSVFV